MTQPTKPSPIERSLNRDDSVGLGPAAGDLVVVRGGMTKAFDLTLLDRLRTDAQKIFPVLIQIKCGRLFHVFGHGDRLAVVEVAERKPTFQMFFLGPRWRGQPARNDHCGHPERAC